MCERECARTCVCACVRAHVPVHACVCVCVCVLGAGVGLCISDYNNVGNKPWRIFFKRQSVEPGPQTRLTNPHISVNTNTVEMCVTVSKFSEYVCLRERAG